MNKLKADYQRKQPHTPAQTWLLVTDTKNIVKKFLQSQENSLTYILNPWRDGYGRRERSEGSPGKVAITCAKDT